MTYLLQKTLVKLRARLGFTPARQPTVSGIYMDPSGACPTKQDMKPKHKSPELSFQFKHGQENKTSCDSLPDVDRTLSVRWVFWPKHPLHGGEPKAQTCQWLIDAGYATQIIFPESNFLLIAPVTWHLVGVFCLSKKKKQRQLSLGIIIIIKNVLFMPQGEWSTGTQSSLMCRTNPLFPLDEDNYYYYSRHGRGCHVTWRGDVRRWRQHRALPLTVRQLISTVEL